MTKRTTADCKNLLVDWHENLPIDCFYAHDYTLQDGDSIMTEDEEEAVDLICRESAKKIAGKAKNWKRTGKFMPSHPEFGERSMMGQKNFSIQTLKNGKIGREYVEVSKIACERHFVCCPDKLDSSLALSVLEDFDGNLYIGEDFSD